MSSCTLMFRISLSLYVNTSPVSLLMSSTSPYDMFHYATYVPLCPHVSTLCFDALSMVLLCPSMYPCMFSSMALSPRFSFMSANSGRSKWEPLVWTMDQILFNFTEVFRMFLKNMYGWCFPLFESLLPPTGSPVSSPAYVPFVPHVPLFASVAVSSYVPLCPLCSHVLLCVTRVPLCPLCNSNGQTVSTSHPTLHKILNFLNHPLASWEWTNKQFQTIQRQANKTVSVKHKCFVSVTLLFTLYIWKTLQFANYVHCCISLNLENTFILNLHNVILIIQNIKNMEMFHHYNMNIKL